MVWTQAFRAGGRGCGARSGAGDRHRAPGTGYAHEVITSSVTSSSTSTPRSTAASSTPVPCGLMSVAFVRMASRPSGTAGAPVVRSPGAISSRTTTWYEAVGPDRVPSYNEAWRVEEPNL